MLQIEEIKDPLEGLKPPFESRSDKAFSVSGDNSTIFTPKRRDLKLQQKADDSLQASLLKSLGTGFTGFISRRKHSLDLDHKEKVRNQDLKNMMKDKLQAWLGERSTGQGQTNQNTTRQAALGIAPTKTFEPKEVKKKEFISPRKMDEIKTVSPHMHPQINISDQDDSNLNQLRKTSSQIMSGAGSMRDRSDSMSAFKKYEKANNNDMSTPLSNPCGFSPSVRPQTSCNVS